MIDMIFHREVIAKFYRNYCKAKQCVTHIWELTEYTIYKSRATSIYIVVV